VFYSQAAAPQPSNRYKDRIMNIIVKSVICALACAASLNTNISQSLAQPGFGTAPAFATSTSRQESVEHIQYRGRYYNRGAGGYRSYGYRRNNSRNFALGLGAAIIGGVILSQAGRAEHRRTRSSDWDRCSETYRSFEPDTGMYTGYDGMRHTCPYLN
jgi:BA14K-like protein